MVFAFASNGLRSLSWLPFFLFLYIDFLKVLIITTFHSRLQKFMSSFSRYLTKILVFSIIFERLADNGRSYQEATTIHLSSYAEDGLRTLAFAYRLLDVSEYESWNKIFTQAKTTIGPEREELLEKASEMIEKDLTLLGVAAIEDKLQKGVIHLFGMVKTL